MHLHESTNSFLQITCMLCTVFVKIPYMQTSLVQSILLNGTQDYFLAKQRVVSSARGDCFLFVQRYLAAILDGLVSMDYCATIHFVTTINLWS